MTRLFVKHGHWADYREPTTLGSHSIEYMICDPTVIQYKHNCCRHPNIIGRLTVLDQLDDGLSGGKGLSCHKGGSIRDGVVGCERREVPAQRQQFSTS